MCGNRSTCFTPVKTRPPTGNRSRGCESHQPRLLCSNLGYVSLVPWFRASHPLHHLQIPAKRIRVFLRLAQPFVRCAPLSCSADGPAATSLQWRSVRPTRSCISSKRHPTSPFRTPSVATAALRHPAPLAVRPPPPVAAFAGMRLTLPRCGPAGPSMALRSAGPTRFRISSKRHPTHPSELRPLRLPCRNSHSNRVPRPPPSLADSKSKTNNCGLIVLGFFAISSTAITHCQIRRNEPKDRR